MGVSLWDIRLGEACVHWSSQNAHYKYENCCLKEGFCNRSYEPTFSTKHCFSAVNCGRSGFFSIGTFGTARHNTNTNHFSAWKNRANWAIEHDLPAQPKVNFITHLNYIWIFVTQHSVLQFYDLYTCIYLTNSESILATLRLDPTAVLILILINHYEISLLYIGGIQFKKHATL